MDGQQVGERKVYRVALHIQVFYLICWAGVIAIAWVQVILSPGGIEYKGLGWHIQADWKDVEGIVQYPLSPGF